MTSDPLTDRLRETLAVFADSRAAEPLTTREVADRLDLGRRATYERLERLADGDHLQTKKVGGGGRVWWRRPRSPSAVGATEAEADDPVEGRRLETYRGIVEAVSDGVYTVDSEGYFTLVNRAYAELTGYSREELVGAHVSKVVDRDTIDTARAFEGELAAGERDAATFEADIRRADGGTVRTEGSFTLLQSESGADERIGVIRDLTEREEAEESLRKSEERFRTMMEQSPFSMQIFDAEGGVLAANSSWERLWDASREELGGYNVLEDEQLQAAGITPYLEEAFAGDVVELPVTHYDPAEIGKPGRDRWIQAYAYPLQPDGDERFEVVLVHQDITERTERERELELYETIFAEARDGVYVLDEDFRFTRVNDAYAEMTGYDREDLLGAHCSLVVGDDVVRDSAQSLEEVFTGTADSATLEADIQQADGGTVRAESRFTGIEDDATGARRKVGIVRDVTERVEHERQLERQREHLAALDDLNGVFQEITDAVIDRSTREGIEEAVCEQLAASDSYRFAWIGDVDTHSLEVVLRTEAGVDGYLDDVTVSIDPDEPTSRGPTGRAVRKGEMQIAGDVEADPRYEPWRGQAGEHGFSSSAAIPIRHEDTLYGVLNVYADRPDAFSADERTVVGRLGEVVGHAISAVNRQRALMSEEVVELGFHVPDLFEVLDLPHSTDGTITFDRTVPLGGDVFLEYGTATGGGEALIEALVESPDLPHWEAVTVADEGSGGEATFELRLSEPPVLSQIAAQGGYVHEARIEDGDYHMEVHLAPSADVRGLVDRISDAYPSFQLATQHQVTHERRSVVGLRPALFEELTDKQLTVLEAAFYAGFFEWPRDRTGEQVADSLDIAPATYHQHLRKAQKKLLTAVFDGEVATG